MFKNYFKTAFRSLVRNRNYTLINIAGLAAGIAICLVIFIIIKFEKSYDNFHTASDRIYRVLTEYHHSDTPDIFYGPGIPAPLPAAMRTDFSQVEKSAAVYSESGDQFLVLNDNGQAVKKFREEKGVFYTEPSFFEIFNFPFLSGDPQHALKDPNSVILSREIADKYFGNWHSAMGKFIKLNNHETLKITGILADVPPNTDLQLKVVTTMGTGNTRRFLNSGDWASTDGSYGCYVRLASEQSPVAFNEQLRAYSKKKKPADDKDSHIIQPLNSVHFDAAVANYSGRSISPELIRALWMIGAFILLIACVNFVNLSTAQAVNRAKEVGVRKVLGSNRSQLKIQFLAETLLIVLAAVWLSIGLAALILPLIKKIVDLPLRLDFIAQPELILVLLVLTVTVTLLAGFYPSLVLAGFNPINALKSRFASKSTRGISLRKSLVVFQFVIAQALIIGTLIIVKQMNFFSNRPLGFDKDAVVNVPFPEDSAGTSKLDYLKKRLMAVNGIQTVSFHSNTPIEDDNDNWTTFTYNHASKETDFYAINKWADDQYLPAYHLQLVTGRNIQPSDTAREFLVDETLLKALGIRDPAQILNKDISLWNGFVKGPVVGVIKQFNARSFRRDLAPVLITSLKRAYNTAGIRLASHDITGTMKSVETIWNEVYPDFVFEYQFLDAKIAGFYKQEKELSQLYQLFAAIAIFLSCLGLYGLASFMAVQRIKEVGIRKVLGASVAHIVYLFSKEFVFLIGIAFLIATPVAWFFMNKWLQHYPYRIEMSWWLFIAGGLASVLVALATVSFQAVKAALTNPVKTLKSE